MTDASAGATELAELSANKYFGGWQKRYSHKSSVLKCEMQFSVFTPPTNYRSKRKASCAVLVEWANLY